MQATDIILVVDSEPKSLAFMTGLLEREGYVVQRAMSGEVALATTTDPLPHLILLDTRLEGIGGFEVCRRLKAHGKWREIPVIFVSVAGTVNERVECLALGA